MYIYLSQTEVPIFHKKGCGVDEAVIVAPQKHSSYLRSRHNARKEQEVALWTVESLKAHSSLFGGRCKVQVWLPRDLVWPTWHNFFAHGRYALIELLSKDNECRKDSVSLTFETQFRKGFIQECFRQSLERKMVRICTVYHPLKTHFSILPSGLCFLKLPFNKSGSYWIGEAGHFKHHV